MVQIMATDVYKNPKVYSKVGKQKYFCVFLSVDTM